LKLLHPFLELEWGGFADTEATNGLYKTELIRRPGQRPLKPVEDVELATLSWMH
jgi:hypothetical protein